MADLHSSAGQYTENELCNVEARMRGYILPNVVRTEEEKKAFNTACLYQIEHERRIAKTFGNQAIPDGMTAFQTGHFSMQFEDGAFTSTLSRKTICDAAYHTLLYAGLLYRGVERSQ